MVEYSQSALPPSLIELAIERYIRANQQCMIWGPPGVGKSSIIKQVAQKLGYEVIDIRLSQMEPTDIRGIPIPYVDPETQEKRVYWAIPNFLPRIPGKKVIILLDELNTAPASVQVAAYQLVLDRKLGDYDLPEGTYVMAAGNRDGDRGATHRMPEPLKNRFSHLEMKVDFDDWLHHALSRNTDARIIGFLMKNKDELFKHDPSAAGFAYATPRSWEFLNTMLKDWNEPLDGRNQLLLQAIVAGNVGEGIAMSFITHLKYDSDLPDVMDILRGKIRKLDSKLQPSALWSLSVKLPMELKRIRDNIDREVGDITIESWHTYFNNYLDFLRFAMQREYASFSIRMCFANKYCAIDMTDGTKGLWPSFSSFMKEFADILGVRK